MKKYLKILAIVSISAVILKEHIDNRIKFKLNEEIEIFRDKALAIEEFQEMEIKNDENVKMANLIY